MATEQDVYNFVISKSPELKGKPFRQVVDFAYSKTPALRDAVMSGGQPKLPSQALAEAQANVPGMTPEGYMPTAQDIKTVLGTPGVLPVAAGLALSPATGGLSGLSAIGAQAAIGGGAELARQAISDKPMSASGVGFEAATQGAIQGLFGAAGAAYGGLRSYVANSPRILDKMAKTISALSKRDLKATTILEGVQRSGVGEKMPQIESALESIKFSPNKATANLAMTEQKIAQGKSMDSLMRLQNRLKNQRTAIGKEIEKVGDELATVADQKGIKINLMPIGQRLVDDIAKVENNEILSGVVNLAPLKKQLSNITKKGSQMSVKDAIATKRMIRDIYLDFSNKGSMGVGESGYITNAMRDTVKQLDDAINGAAKTVGDKNYSKTYSKFGKFANKYDFEFVPMFGSKEGRLAVSNRVEKLARDVNSGGIVLEIIKDTKDLLPKDAFMKSTAKVMDNLTDYSVLNAIYQDLGGAPSSNLVGVSRMALEPAARSLVKIRQPISGGSAGNIATPIIGAGINSNEK